ncbi:hypothetical protein [Rhodococcus sp. NPDC049939]|uniref:hypothetical protein n=1 Tax=Rhodococcus sp. NPDC049939 TaxID=3155511 RepID=UPI003408988C
MATTGWEFWRLTRTVDGELAWLGATRPEARSPIDRKKVWTLLPSSGVLVANWYVSEDHWRAETGESLWIHEKIEAYEARDVALEVPKPDPEDLARLTRPERYLTLDQIDRHSVEKVLGKRVADALFVSR